MLPFFAWLVLATPPPAAPPAPAAATASQAPAVTPAQAEAAVKAWPIVYEVLMSPRCMNCHPDGDRPLQTDAHLPHKMNISRQSEANGLKCATCHQTQNSEAFGIAGGPPGAPHWQLPHKEMPLIFQGRSLRQLCLQLKDPAQNGGRDLNAIHHHVVHDPLVLWGWNPGGNRTKPPHSHAKFVEAVKTWVDGGGACPTE